MIMLYSFYFPSLGYSNGFAIGPASPQGAVSYTHLTLPTILLV